MTEKSSLLLNSGTEFQNAGETVRKSKGKLKSVWKTVAMSISHIKACGIKLMYFKEIYNFKYIVIFFEK